MMPGRQRKTRTERAPELDDAAIRHQREARQVSTPPGNCRPRQRLQRRRVRRRHDGLFVPDEAREAWHPPDERGLAAHQTRKARQIFRRQNRCGLSVLDVRPLRSGVFVSSFQSEGARRSSTGFCSQLAFYESIHVQLEERHSEWSTVTVKSISSYRMPSRLTH